MKGSIIVLLLVALTTVANAQKTTSVASEIDKVKVYPRGAQIERNASHRLTTGRHVITFSGLETELVPASINVSANQEVTILSVSTQTNYLNEQPKPEEVIALEDSLKRNEFDHLYNQNMLQVYNYEREMILANKQLGGEEASIVIEDLEDMSDFYRDRLADIMLKQMEINSKQTILEQEIARLKSQLNEFNRRLNKATGEVRVEVYAQATTNASFKVKYMVNNAGWTPVYNVNVSDVNNPVDLVYNARVYQNTGIDWDDVDLTLTNANPNLNNNKPVMHPWRLQYIEAYADMKAKRDGYVFNQPMAATALADEESIEVGSTVDYPVNDAATEFSIKSRQTIPANGKNQVINIDRLEIGASYEYYTAPKLNPSAFLVARIHDFDQYNLLQGQASLFLSNTYVGRSYLDPNIVEDTMDLSLGRDQSIVVERRCIDDFTQTKIIGNNKKISKTEEIVIRNTKSVPVKIMIQDQLPVSSDKDIEVDAESLNGATFEEKTGFLFWELEIPANGSVSKRFSYSVKYPSDKKINL